MSVESTDIVQGYLCREPHRTVRIRIKGDKGFITVKGINHGAVRQEWEYEIAVADARQMLRLCMPPIIDKTRHLIPASGTLIWELDQFRSPRPGLWVAEIELPTPDTPFDHPDWLGEEVTGDPAYYNSNL